MTCTFVYRLAMQKHANGFGDWLEAELQKRDWTQADFGRLVEKPSSVVSRWVSGAVTPSGRSIATISRVLAVDPSEVYATIGGERRGSPRSPEDILAELEANQPVAVPVIRDVVAHMGAGGGFIDDYVFLPPAYRRRRSKNILSLIAHGDCMSPQIEDGDVVVFDKDAPWKANDIVVAGVDGYAVIRRVVDVSGKPMLRADADGSTHSIGAADHIFGRVIYVMRPLLKME
jgi:SOS-response transcriptional repressor LexA